MKYFVLYLKSVAVFMLFSILAVGIYSFFSSTFFDVWDYYHDLFLIPLFWRVVPIITVVYACAYMNSNFRNVLKQSAKYSEPLHVFFFGIIGVTVIAAAGQTAGGCIWQIPYFIMDTPGYSWDRYGYTSFPWYILMSFYGIATVLLYKLHRYIFNEYLDTHTQKQHMYGKFFG